MCVSSLHLLDLKELAAVTRQVLADFDVQLLELDLVLVVCGVPQLLLLFLKCTISGRS